MIELARCTYTPVTEWMKMTLDEIGDWRQALVRVLDRESEARKEAAQR